MKNYLIILLLIFLAGFINGRMDNSAKQPWKTPVPTAQETATVNYGHNSSFAFTGKKIDETTKGLNRLPKLADLKIQILNINEDGETRQKALYDLSQIATAEATRTLAEIAGTEIPAFEHLENPHSTGTYRFRNELALRITALENLDLRLIKETEAKAYLINILQNQRNSTLQFLTQLSLDGIMNQKPGKLNRVIEAMLAEKK